MQGYVPYKEDTLNQINYVQLFLTNLHAFMAGNHPTIICMGSKLVFNARNRIVGRKIPLASPKCKRKNNLKTNVNSMYYLSIRQTEHNSSIKTALYQ